MVRSATSVRVRSLTYLERWLSPGISFTSPRPASFRIGAFDAVVEEERWTFTPITDFSSAESARASLEPLLRDWETEWDVVEQLRLCFEFKSCVLEAHAEDGTAKLAVVTLSAKELSLGAAYNLKRPAPSPPSGTLHYTPLAGQLRARWHEIEDGSVRLLVGANLVRTSLISEFGGSQKGTARDVAARRLNVAPKVLATLGCLCDRNDPDEGRKVKHEENPLTSSEKTWVYETIKMLVRRAVEINSGIVGLPFVRMEDLPRL